MLVSSSAQGKSNGISKNISVNVYSERQHTKTKKKSMHHHSSYMILGHLRYAIYFGGELVLLWKDTTMQRQLDTTNSS